MQTFTSGGEKVVTEQVPLFQMVRRKPLGNGAARTFLSVFTLLYGIVIMAMPVIAAENAPLKIVALGDSLTAGYLLPADKAFPPVLARALKERGHAVEIINAGVSGDTTAAGLERLGWAVPQDADAVIVELGANDALRGLSATAARDNLDKILTALKAQKSEILLAGMHAPRNLGEAYVAAFDAMFAELAQKHDALLYPFFLERIALKANLNLADGIHPNEKGVEEIVAGILPKVEELIARVKAKRAAGG